MSERFRIFVCFADHVEMAEAPEGVEEAMDIMMADNVPADRAAQLAVAAAQSGKDPVAFAKHFTKVRREFRATKE